MLNSFTHFSPRFHLVPVMRSTRDKIRTLRKTVERVIEAACDWIATTVIPRFPSGNWFDRKCARRCTRLGNGYVQRFAARFL